MDDLAIEFEDALADLIAEFKKKGLDDEAIISTLELRKMAIEEESE